MRWKIIIVLFFLGLCARSVVFIGPHREGDEVIYMTLVDQLDRGNGYTLQGTRLLDGGDIDGTGYDRPYFFHPPGGVGLFWVFHRIFGSSGYPLVQIFCYALFFWSMMLLARLLGIASSRTGLIAAGALSAFTPIMGHVAASYWLDGPQLAFCAAAAALFLQAAVRGSSVRACIAGALLGYATLIKITALLIIPGVVLLAWSLQESKSVSPLIRPLFFFLFTALIVHLPWEIWLWIKVGTPFPGWAGKPSENLVATNSYVRYLTVVRSPWIYLTLLLRILWTIPAGILLLLSEWKNGSVRYRSVSLYVWIATVLAFHIILGHMGYSKVIRYVILVTPATILAFSLLAAEAAGRINLRAPFRSGNTTTAAVLTIACAAFLLEIAAGVHTVIHHDMNLILPIIGGP